MKQETVDYFKNRVIKSSPKISGDITTHVTVLFDNGITAEGCSVRDINGYDKAEAEDAAFQDAVSVLAPGVEFISSLKKTA